MSASLIGRLGASGFRLSTYSGVDVAHGLVLLFGIGTKALPAWDSRTRRNNLLGDLAIGRSKRTCELTSSIVPRGTSFHRWWSSSVLLLDVILSGVHAAATACSRGQHNSGWSTP